MVLVGISQERVIRQSLIEIAVKIEDVYNVELDRVKLIEESVPDVSVISV